MVPSWSSDAPAVSNLVANFLDGLRDALAVEGLEQIIDRVHFERLHRVLVVGGGEDDLRQRNLAVHQLLDDAEAVEARHLHVEEDEVGRELLDEVDRLDAVLALRDDIDVELAQEIRKLVARKLLVVNDDRGQCHLLSCIQNTAT